MKQQLKKILVLSLLITIVFACSKEEQEQLKSSLEDLKSIDFKETEEKIISSEKTGSIVYDSTTGTNKYEYLTIVQKPYKVSPLLLATETNKDIIYPGSMLRGGSFLKGKYDPLVLRNEFYPVTLSLDLKGNINISERTSPTLSKVRITMNQLIALQKNNIDYSFVPSNYVYDSNAITTQESFKKALKIHAETDIMFGLVKASFDYNKENTNNFTKKYVMVSFRQSLYNASIDPKHYSDWIKGEIDLKDMGEYEPLYVSSVDYGRVGYVLVQTEKTTEEVKKMIKASLDVELITVDVSANLEYKKQFQKLFSENKVKVVINGGPLELGGQVDSYESFKKFIQMPNADNLVSSSVPISYKVRRLKDNTEVEVRDTYTEKIYELKNN